MDRSVNTKTDRQDKQNETFSVDIWVRLSDDLSYTFRIYNQATDSCSLHFSFSHTTLSIIQNCRLMQLIWFLNKAPEAVKWWKQKDRAVMVDQLMNLVLSCNTEEKLSCVFLRITKSHIQLIQVQLFSFFLQFRAYWKRTKPKTSGNMYVCVHVNDYN